MYQVFENLAESNQRSAVSQNGTASPDLDHSAPGYLTPASEKKRVPGAQITPLDFHKLQPSADWD
jgi:hypothetical protein